MKMLLPPDKTVIPSNRPRTRRGPDSRGIRICFAELGRSCALKQGYLIFTDGSAYVYTAPSNADVENLCAQIQRGRFFNFATRRAAFGFVRGFTPPPDYETIYSYPPYGGVTPAACPLMTDWDSLVWDGYLNADPSNHCVSGTGKIVTCAYGGGMTNVVSFQSNNIVIQSDAPYVDCELSNDGGTPSIQGFLIDVTTFNTISWMNVLPGAPQTLRLFLVNGSTFFFGGAGGSVPSNDPLTWTLTLIPP